MQLVALYYGALLNLHATESYLTYSVPGQCSENVSSKGGAGALPEPGPHLLPPEKFPLSLASRGY